MNGPLDHQTLTIHDQLLSQLHYTTPSLFFVLHLLQIRGMRCFRRGDNTLGLFRINVKIAIFNLYLNIMFMKYLILAPNFVHLIDLFVCFIISV